MVKRIAWAVAGAVVVTGFGVFLYSQLARTDDCDVCYRPMHQETYYRIHLEDGESLDVCCPRCGLRFQEGREDVVAAEVTDFQSRTLIDASDAYFVENSRVHFCAHSRLQEDRTGSQYEVAWDRCLPSLIAFSSREAATAFREQNGGVVKRYQELLAEGY